MTFWNRKNKNDKKDPQPEKPSKKSPEKPKESLSQKFRRTTEHLRGLRLKDIGPMTRHTLSDLKKPKEAGGLVVAIIVPGGMFGWFAYRIDKYRRRIANDNTPPAASQNQAGKKPKAPKSGTKKQKPPKPPKP
mgnify:FL=1